MLVFSAFFMLTPLPGLYIISKSLCAMCDNANDKQEPTRVRLHRLWLAVRTTGVFLGCNFGIAPVMYWTGVENMEAGNINQPSGANCTAVLQASGDCAGAGADVALLTLGPSIAFFCMSLLSHPPLRARFTRFIGSLGQGGGELQQAACVAALVGGREARKAIVTGAKRFRKLSLGLLRIEDLTSNVDTGLNARTVPCELGECEAFMSHSWRDDGASKYTQLCEWAQPFLEKSHTPSIWLDKACIDQNDIDGSLAGLPIFLSGCQTLLILAGETYASRLWCVMEVYTFVQMGGKSDRVALRPLGGFSGFARFDAAKANCFLPKDKHKLLAVIEAGFGDLRSFNVAVRKMLSPTSAAGAVNVPPVQERMMLAIPREDTPRPVVVVEQHVSSSDGVITAPSGATQPAQFCAQCGHPFEGAQKFCGKCGGKRTGGGADLGFAPFAV